MKKIVKFEFSIYAQKGHSPPLPQFLAHVNCGQTVAHLSYCWPSCVIIFYKYLVALVYVIQQHNLWSPYVIGRPYIFSCCGLFVLLSSSFFSSPNLSRRRLDVYHTSTHGVALVRISDAGLKPAAGGSLKTQDAKKSPKIAIWAPSHNFVGLYLCN